MNDPNPQTIVQDIPTQIEQDSIDDTTEIVVTNNDTSVQLKNDDKVIANDKIVELIHDALSMIDEDRQISKDLYDKITKEFSKFHEITMKSEGAVRALEAMGKSTDRLNNLLATIQKFNTDKTQKDIADSIISATDKNSIIDFLEAAGVGPKRMLEDNKKIEILKQEIKNEE